MVDVGVVKEDVVEAVGVVVAKEAAVEVVVDGVAAEANSSRLM